MRTFRSTDSLKEEGGIKEAASTYLNKSEYVLFHSRVDLGGQGGLSPSPLFKLDSNFENHSILVS